MATRPQAIGYALLDSPVALAAWMLDHDTDSYYKISRAFVDGRPTGRLTRDTILDNITLYWLTGTGTSAARSYWEGGRARASAAAAGQAPAQVSLSVGFTTFPGEIWASPRSWVEQAYPNSPTSTRLSGAATSPPGKSPSSSRERCERRSGHFGEAVGRRKSDGRTQVPGISRTDLRRHDLSVSGRKVIQNRVDIGPEAPFVKHPGEEIIDVLEGTLEYHVDDGGRSSDV